MKHFSLVVGLLVLVLTRESAAISEEFEKIIVTINEEFEKIREDLVAVIKESRKGKDKMEHFRMLLMIDDLLDSTKKAEDLLAAINMDGKRKVVMDEFEKIIEDFLTAINNDGKGNYIFVENFKNTKEGLLDEINKNGNEKVTEKEFEGIINDLIATIHVSNNILSAIKYFKDIKGKFRMKQFEKNMEEFLIKLSGILLTPKRMKRSGSRHPRNLNQENRNFTSVLTSTTYRYYWQR